MESRTFQEELCTKISDDCSLRCKLRDLSCGRVDKQIVDKNFNIVYCQECNETSLRGCNHGVHLNVSTLWIHFDIFIYAKRINR